MIRACGSGSRLMMEWAKSHINAEVRLAIKLIDKA
jgi:hypothetical protein